MDPAAPIQQQGCQSDVLPVPGSRRRVKVVLIAALLLLPVVLAVLVVFQKGKPLSASTLKISQISPALPFGRMAMLRIENKSGNALLVWEPCRVVRKETGKIIVGGTQERLAPLRGTNSPRGANILAVPVQLTGTNHGPWRVLVPVARYELLARLDTLFQQRIGTLGMKFSPIKSLLRNSKMWVASDWFEENSQMAFGSFSNRLATIMVSHVTPPPPAAPAGDPYQSESWRTSHGESSAFMNMLHRFHHQFGRWPTNLAEVTDYAKSNGEVPPFSRFDDAIFTAGPDDRLAVAYDHGHGSMSVSESGLASSLPPPRAYLPLPLPPVPVPSVTPPPRIQPNIVTPSLPAIPYSTNPSFQFGGMPSRGFRGPDDTPQTVMFIASNFRAQCKRWPTNGAELKAFAGNPANFQPEFPSNLEEPFESAVFKTGGDGGLKITYKNGSMSLAKPK